jgi:hypothetical protein
LLGNGGSFWSYLPVIALGAAILIGVPWAYWTWKEAKGEVEEGSTGPEDLLGPLAEAYAAGQMSTEEYKRIRDSVLRTAGLVSASDLPPKPTPPPQPPAPGPADNPPPAGADQLSSETPPPVIGSGG